YGKGLSDWAVEEVTLEEADGGKPVTAEGGEAPPTTPCKVVVDLVQKGEYLDPTTLGIALPGGNGYSVRIPILPQAQSYQLDEPPTSVRATGARTMRVEVLLPERPTQIAVDPDQVLVDREPDNNYWKRRARLRFTPVYTFLEETDLTNAYDRWN